MNTPISLIIAWK